MKKILSLLTLLLCVVGGANAESGTEAATNTGTKDTNITGTSYTISGTYIAGSGGATATGMANKGVKFRTGSDGSRLVFTVNTGYKITGFRLYGVSNYALKSGASEPCISVTKVEVDGTETTQTGTGNFPAKGSSTAGSVLLSGISATETIAIYFDNNNASGTQINGYYELDWETVASSVPLSTTITPSSASVVVGYTTTLTGAFTGGDFEGEWLSSNESVATVSQAGVVTGVAAGTATITYQWKEDQSQDAYKATATITVTEPEAVGAASTRALDITQYATINLTDAYSYDSDNRVLVVSANQIRANSGTQKWMSYVDAGGAEKTWSATDVFKGSTFYNTGSSNNAVVLRSGRTYTLRVTNCEEISALVLSGGSSKTSITIQMAIYELDSYGIDRTSETPVTTKSTTSTSVAVLTASGLDKTKVYEATFTSTHASSNSYVYEVAFTVPDTRTATSLSFSAAAYDAEVGTAFTAPTLTKDPENLEGVTFSSSNTSVATVNASTGEVTIVAVGETTITATFAATETYKASTASYTLTVTDPNATTVTATFAFDTGAEGQTAVVSVEDVFSVTSVGVADMTYAGVGSDQDITGTKLQPVSSASDDKSQYAKFTVTPKKGITFTPTKISFDALRWGTDGNNKLHYYAESGTTSTELGNVNPNRNGKGNGWSHYEHEISGINATSDAAFSLACYIYGLANNKQISFANIVIEGEYSGEAQDETMYTITTGVTPDGAGSISQNPAGASLTEGTAVTFTATANTGYLFLNKWMVNGSEVDGETYSVASLSEDLEVVAQFKKLYAVSYSAGEGSKGTTTAVLTTDYTEGSYTTPAANYYIARDGYTVTGWTDGENSYDFGQAITLTADITLSPIFTANTKSISDTEDSEVTVTYGFDTTNGNPAINLENSTGYYVKQAAFGGETIDVPMFIDNLDDHGIDGKRGKTNNVGNSTAQVNTGAKFTLPAVSGMKVVIGVANGSLDGTTIAGDNYDGTYTYTGREESIDIIFTSNNLYINNVVVTYPATYITKTISSAGYATLYSKYPLDFTGSGLTAYIATISGTAVSFSEVTSIPAKTGVLLKGDAGEKTITVAVSNTDVSENKFEGVLEDTEIESGIFVLMNDSRGLGFYKTKNAFTVGANTAYLPADVVAEGRSFIGIDETPTGVEAISSKQTAAGTYYNLNGQRVTMPTKGLYIVNGKKVMK